MRTKIRVTFVAWAVCISLIVLAVVTIRAGDFDHDEVTLTATWTKYRPEAVSYSVDGGELTINLRTLKTTDSWSVSVPYHDGGTYWIGIWMGTPPKSGYSYGCSITRNGTDIAIPHSSVVPGGVSCHT